ncbi:hypothetical protein IF1G_11358 [Cordyceps javanica]|uniref:BTB domain-containing protein n=1 Tax=Cordyceps javanica TaxID=43265 RepID=A0A545UKJ0_9HYPO|nr:hypothetical protein IF1G_11358 [Cordyceps javanica]
MQENILAQRAWLADTFLEVSLALNSLVPPPSLFDSGKYSDLLIIGSRHYNAHKNIVFCYSTILETASRFPRKAALRSVLHDTTDDGAINGQVGSSDHGLSDSASPNLPCIGPSLEPVTARDRDTVDLRGEHPIAVDCMMQFFYLTNYDTKAYPIHDPIDGSTKQHDLQIHSPVYKLAEVYAVDELKALALAKFKQALSGAVDAADFAAAAGEAYADMVESLDHLRQAVIKGLDTVIKFSTADLLTWPSFTEMLFDHLSPLPPTIDPTNKDLWTLAPSSQGHSSN